MKVFHDVTLDITPDVKRTGFEIASDTVALEFTTVTNAWFRIEMTRDEWNGFMREFGDFVNER